MRVKSIIKSFDLIRTVVAMLIAYALSLIIILFISKDPVNAILQFVVGPFEGLRRIGNIVEYMIPIVLTGLGMSMMLQVNQFNLLGEGIFFLSGSVITLIATMVLPSTVPPVLFPTILIVLGGILGGALAFIPAILKIKWSANEVVVTIMLNYVLVLFGKYLLMYVMKDPKVTYNGSLLIPESAKLPVVVPGTQVHFGLFLVIAAVFLCYWFLYRTTRGYEIRMTGANPDFAKYAGIGVVGSLILAQMLGGALAGMGGAIEILGKYDRFKWMVQTGYGFDGMMVAVIARKNPAIVPLAALFLAYIRIGSDIVGRQTDVPLEFISVIQALVIMLVAAELFMAKFKHKLVVKKSMLEKGE